MFSTSPFVQHTGTVTAPATVVAVHVNNGKLFASTAVQTLVFVGGVNAGSVPFSMTTLAPVSGDVVFAGSNDRTLRAIDFSAPGTPVDIFRADLAPSNGTINRVTSLALAGGRVYAGAGDIGIADFDKVDITNLHRQVLYGTSQVGQPKLSAAIERLHDLNPEISIEAHETAINSEKTM